MRPTAALQICFSLAVLTIAVTSQAQVKKPPFRVPVFNAKGIKGDSPLMKSVMITGPRLSQEQGKASRPAVAVEGNNVYVAYTAIHNATDYLPQGNNVWFTHSDDGGLHFYPAKLVASGGASALISPRIAVEKGYIWVAFIQRDTAFSPTASLRLSESKDSGQSFSTPYVVEPAAGFSDASIDDNGFNYLAVSGGAAFCAWGDTDANVYFWKEGGGPVIRINPEITIGSGRGVTRASAFDAEVYAYGRDVFVAYTEATGPGGNYEEIATFPGAGNFGPLQMPAATIPVGQPQAGRVEAVVDGNSLLVAYASSAGFNVSRLANWHLPSSPVTNIVYTTESNAVPAPIPGDGQPRLQQNPNSAFNLFPAVGGTALTWLQGWNIQQTAWCGFIPSGATTMPRTVQVTKSYENLYLASAQFGDKTELFFPDTTTTSSTDYRLYTATVGGGAAEPAHELYPDPNARGLTLVTVGDHMLAFWRTGQDYQADLPILWSVVNP